MRVHRILSGARACAESDESVCLRVTRPTRARLIADEAASKAEAYWQPTLLVHAPLGRDPQVIEAVSVA